MSTSYLGENLVPEPVLDQARQEKARKYARLKRRLTLVDLALTGTLLLILVFNGLSTRLASFFILPVVPAATIYFITLMMAYGLLSAPLSYYGGFVLPRRYGLSIQKFTGWLGDMVKAGALGLALGASLVAAIYWFIASFPQVWWLLAWGLVVLVSLILTILAPIIIVPIFFKMEKLTDTDLKSRLEQLAQRAGIQVGGIYTVEFSSKSTTANAALMGLGRTKRIALSDTLLKRYSPLEIEVIMAHELGHNLHKDVFRLFAVQAALLAIGFYATALILKASIIPLGFNGISDVAALPLLMLVFTTVILLMMPLAKSYSRRLEARADDFALKLTDDPKAFIKAMTRLTDQNLDEAQPNRWVELLLYDHPSYASRVEHARYYATHKPN